LKIGEKGFKGISQGKKKEIERKLEQLLEELMKKKCIKQAILGVESGDGSLNWIGARGVANAEGEKMTPETPFWIASVTKLFIASTILRLQENGKLSLEDKIGTYLPADLIEGIHKTDEEKDHSKEITIQQLLGHFSGLPDYIETKKKGDKSLFEEILEEGDKEWGINEVLQRVRDYNKPLFPPQEINKKGKKARYSDTNYQLLIAIIESVMKKPLAEVFREMIFKPLGLEKTFSPDLKTFAGENSIGGVWYKDQQLKIPRAMASFQDLFSTAEELLIFMKALVKGEIFVRRETLNLMTGEWNRLGFSLSRVGPGWPMEYGLGILRFTIPGYIPPFQKVPEIIGHSGASGSWLFFCPDWDLYLVGNVSQISAPALPFQFVPKLMRELRQFL